MRGVVLVALAALIGGFTVGRLLPAPTGAVEVRAAVGAAPEPCPELEPVRRALDERRRELGVLQAALWRGALAEADVVGLPVEWPDDLPDAFREEGVEDALRAAIGRGEVLSLDCSEYPCVAIVAYDSRDGAVMAQQQAAADRLDADGYQLWSEPSMHGDPHDPDRRVLVMTHAFVAPGTASLVPEVRKRFRFDELSAAAAPALEVFLAQAPLD